MNIIFRFRIKVQIYSWIPPPPLNNRHNLQLEGNISLHRHLTGLRGCKLFVGGGVHAKYTLRPNYCQQLASVCGDQLCSVTHHNVISRLSHASRYTVGPTVTQIYSQDTPQSWHTWQCLFSPKPTSQCSVNYSWLSLNVFSWRGVFMACWIGWIHTDLYTL